MEASEDKENCYPSRKRQHSAITTHEADCQEFCELNYADAGNDKKWAKKPILDNEEGVKYEKLYFMDSGKKNMHSFHVFPEKDLAYNQAIQQLTQKMEVVNDKIEMDPADEEREQEEAEKLVYQNLLEGIRMQLEEK